MTGRAGRPFEGFPEGKADPTPIPPAFFAELLPAIDHLGELKLTLYTFWALARRESAFRYLTLPALLGDRHLMEAFEGDAGGRPALEDALERCVRRGSLLRIRPQDDPQAETLYFLNTPKGRAAADGYARGDWSPSGDAQSPVELGMDRPNVFSLYEQNIGPLTPMIAERLREAEQTFPSQWIEDALRIAVENNVRKWSYVQAILDDWQRRGRDAREDRGDTEKARRRYLEGELADSSGS